MRRYDDPVEVRRGMVAGPGGSQEGPEQFLWRGRLWKVHDVVAHWVETGAWWRSGSVGAVLGSDVVGGAGITGGPSGGTAPGALTATVPSTTAPSTTAPSATAPSAASPAAVDLAAEREVWRVEAARGLRAAQAGDASGHGVFDLSFDWTDGTWRLTRCAD